MDIITNEPNKLPKKIFVQEKGIVFNVIDERKTERKTVIGNNNKKISFESPVADYIKDYFNRSLSLNKDSTNIRLVTVYLDQFRLEDNPESDKLPGVPAEISLFPYQKDILHERSIKYSLRFSYPVSKDSSLIFRISSKYTDTAKHGLTNNELIDFTLTECLDSFFNIDSSLGQVYSADQFENISNKKIITSPFFNEKGKEILSDSSSTSGKTKKNTKISGYSNAETGTSLIGITYFSGDKITNGFQLYYLNNLITPGKNYILGFGACLTLYDIVNGNREDILLNVGLPLQFQYYFSGYERGFYFGATVRLMVGAESKDNSEFIKLVVGPVIEPHIGIKISKKFSLDGGVYFLKFMGSDLLPEDKGIRFNLNIWL